MLSVWKLFCGILAVYSGLSAFAHAEEVEAVNVVKYYSVDGTVDFYDGPQSANLVATRKIEELKPPPFPVIWHPDNPNLLQYSDSLWLPAQFVVTDEKVYVIKNPECLFRELRKRQTKFVAKAKDYGSNVNRGLGAKIEFGECEE